MAAAYDFDTAALVKLAGEPAASHVDGALPARSQSTDIDIESGEEIVERYAEAARALASALNADVTAPGLDLDAHPDDGEHLRRQVPLIGGWLPGAAVMNTLASSRPGAGWRDRLALSVSTRVAVQLAVAAALAVTFADLISPNHVIWAIVAVYVTFLGSASDLEQTYKAGLRVAGTLVGVVVGGELAYLTAPHTLATVVVIALAVYFMYYFGKVNYALVVFAATVGVTQFYAQVGELSNTILATRLEVTAVGAACAIVVGLFVLPLRTVNAATLAVARYFRALAQVLDGLSGRDFSTATNRPTTDSRVLDATFHAATATLRPMTRTLFGPPKKRCARVLKLVDISHELGRAIVQDSAAPARTGEEMAQIASVSEQAAAIARSVADDLERPTGSRPVAGVATESNTPRPSTTSLRTEVEGIAAVVTELAQIRGLATPDLTILNSPTRATSRLPG